MSLKAASLSSVVPVNSVTLVSSMTLGSEPVSGRQSSRVTKVPLAELHRVFMIMESLSAMKKKEEEEVEKEIEGEKEENNTQGRRHMCMDGMNVKRQMRAALSHVECDVNTSDDATTDCVQCAQQCAHRC